MYWQSVHFICISFVDQSPSVSLSIGRCSVRVVGFHGRHVFLISWIWTSGSWWLMGLRTTATSRRATLRRGARMRKLSQVISSLVGLVADVRCRGGTFGSFVDAFEKGRTALAGRSCGDLVPIPNIVKDDILASFSCASPFITEMTQIVNFSLAGINFVYGGFRAIRTPRYASAVQRSAQLRFAAKWWGLVRQASRSDDFLDGFSSPIDFSNTSSFVSCATWWLRRWMVIIRAAYWIQTFVYRSEIKSFSVIRHCCSLMGLMESQRFRATQVDLGTSMLLLWSAN